MICFRQVLLSPDAKHEPLDSHCFRPISIKIVMMTVIPALSTITLGITRWYWALKLLLTCFDCFAPGPTSDSSYHQDLRRLRFAGSESLNSGNSFLTVRWALGLDVWCRSSSRPRKSHGFPYCPPVYCRPTLNNRVCLGFSALMLTLNSAGKLFGGCRGRAQEL